MYQRELFEEWRQDLALVGRLSGLPLPLPAKEP